MGAGPSWRGRWTPPPPAAGRPRAGLARRPDERVVAGVSRRHRPLDRRRPAGGAGGDRRAGPGQRGGRGRLPGGVAGAAGRGRRHRGGARRQPARRRRPGRLAVGVGCVTRSERCCWCGGRRRSSPTGWCGRRPSPGSASAWRWPRRETATTAGGTWPPGSPATRWRSCGAAGWRGSASPPGPGCWCSGSAPSWPPTGPSRTWVPSACRCWPRRWAGRSSWDRGCTGWSGELGDERRERIRSEERATWPPTSTTRCCRPWP